MTSDRNPAVPFQRLTTGGQLVIRSARLWAAADGRASLICDAFMAAGLPQAVASLNAFLATVTVAARTPLALGPVERPFLSTDEHLLIRGLAALQQHRPAVGRSLFGQRIPALAARMAQSAGLRLAQAMADRGLRIGLHRTDATIPPVAHPVVPTVQPICLH